MTVLLLTEVYLLIICIRCLSAGLGPEVFLIIHGLIIVEITLALSPLAIVVRPRCPPTSRSILIGFRLASLLLLSLTFDVDATESHLVDKALHVLWILQRLLEKFVDVDAPTLLVGSPVLVEIEGRELVPDLHALEFCVQDRVSIQPFVEERGALRLLVGGALIRHL